MGQFKLDAREVGMRARGNWDRIFASLAPALGHAIDKKGRHVSCPVHGGSDGFRLHKTAEDGQGICNTCHDFVKSGQRKWLDGFGILMWLTEDGFPKVLEDVASIVAPELLRTDRRISSPAVVTTRKATPPVRTEKEVEGDLRLVEKMRLVWNSGVPISDRSAVLGHRYFESRGLPVPTAADGVDSELRLVPLLDYFDKDTGQKDRFPAVVALVRNVEGRVRAVHRIYLARDGYGKAPVSAPKKMMGKPDVVSLQGCSVHLGRPGVVLATAEGIETAWAVRAFTGFTVWPAVNSTLMRMWYPPKGVSGVHIFGDNDRSGEGQDATMCLKTQLVERGYSVRADLPPGDIPVGQKSLDWEDLYREHGDRAIWKVASLREELASRKIIPLSGNSHR